MAQDFACAYRFDDNLEWATFPYSSLDHPKVLSGNINGVWSCGGIYQTFPFPGAVGDTQVRITLDGVDYFTTIDDSWKEGGDKNSGGGEIAACPLEEVTEASRNATLTPILNNCSAALLLTRANDLCVQAMNNDPVVLEIWLTQCLVEICQEGNATEERAFNVSQNYNVTGEPLDKCDRYTQALATKKCYEELTTNCEVTPEWLQACVGDVCALATTGDPNPEYAADGFCGPQNALKEILDELENNDDALPNLTGIPLGTTTATTTTIALGNRSDDQYLWCGGAFESRETCAIPATLEHCQWFCETDSRAGSNRCEQEYYGPDAEQVRIRNLSSEPPGCYKHGHYGVNWMGYNLYPFPDAVGKDHPDYQSEEQQNLRATYGKGRLCCGNLTLPPPTTTTTTLPWLPVVEEDRGAPLQPLPVTTDAVTIARPAGAKVGVCFMHGDPHIHPFDNPSGPMFNFYGSGNFWIVRSDPVWIQGYYKAANIRRPTYTHLQKIAIGGPFLQGNTLMFETHKSWFNDEVIFVDNPVGTTVWTGMNGKVTATMEHWVGQSRYHRCGTWSPRSRNIVITFPNDVRIKIWNHWENTRGRHCGFFTAALNIVVTMRQISDQDGHCGTFDQDASDDTHNLLKQRWSGNVESSKVLIPY